MAGDWIKMRGNLWDDPRVGRIADITDTTEATVIGGLYWLWASADQHTENGVMPGLSIRRIDSKTGIKGFGDALVSIGWLADHPDGVSILKFEEHNGSSAKKRCQTAKRVAAFKAGNAEETNNDEEGNAPIVTETLPVRDLEKEKELEKEKREEKEKSISGKTVGAADAANPPAAKSVRLPDGWQLPKAWGEWALAEYTHWTPEIVRLEGQKFGDHWRTKSGKEGRKADWPATWRNWCRSDICQRSHPLQRSGRPQKNAHMTDSERAAWIAEEGAKAERLVFGDGPSGADVIDLEQLGV
ncbi:MAG: hypothetical protein WC829_02925 [Hyphomicrobium sp.]|jgi:hypothetical protein